MAGLANLGGKAKLLVLGAAAVVVVAAGSAGAYFGVVVPNKPENVLRKSITNFLSEDKTTSKGKFRFENLKAGEDDLKVVDVDFTQALDRAKNSSAFSMEINMAGVKIPMEFRVVDNSLFFKVGNLESLANVVALENQEYAEVIRALSSSVADKWYEVDDTLLKQYKSDCFVNQSMKLSNEDIKLIDSSFSKNSFAKVKKSSNDTVNGKAALKLELDFDKDKAKSFGKDMENLTIIKNLNKCAEDAGAKTADSEDKTTDDIAKRNNTFTVWVDKSTKKIVKVEATSGSDQNKATLTVDVENGKADVSKPDGAKPVTDLLNDLGPVFGGGTTSTDFDPSQYGNYDF